MVAPHAADSVPNASGRPWLEWLTVALFVVPVVIDLVRGGTQRLFSYVAADTFYYLTVSRNIATTGASTFDQVHPTNGFHPLWQAVLTAVDVVMRALGASDATMLSLAVWISLVFCTLALWLLMRAMRLAWGESSTLLPILTVGAYGLLVAPLWWSLSDPTWQAQNRGEGPLPLYGTLWSFVNGMESGVLLCAFAALVWFYVIGRPLERTRDALILGALAGAVALARLDHAVISVSVCGVVALSALRSESRTAYTRCALVIGMFALCLGTFMAWSYVTCGTPMPTSGSLKSTFPLIHNENFERLRGALRGLDNGRRNLNVEWRIAQLCVPALAALLSIPLLVRARFSEHGITLSMARPNDRLDPMLLVTALSTLIMVGYVWLFVRGGHQGHWYFPISVLFVSLLVLRIPRPRWAYGLASSAWSRGAIAFVLAVVSLVHFQRLHAPVAYHARYAHFFLHTAPVVRAQYAANPPKLLSIDDGIVAYATGFPTMNGLGLTLDPEGVIAKRDGKLLKLAVARGYNHVTSLVYAPLGRFEETTPSAQLARYLGGWLGPTAGYQFELSYRDPSSDFGIVRVSKR